MSSQTGVKSIDWANTLPGQQVEPVQGRLVDVPACSLLVVTAGQLCLFCQRLEEGGFVSKCVDPQTHVFKTC